MLNQQLSQKGKVNRSKSTRLFTLISAVIITFVVVSYFYHPVSEVDSGSENLSSSRESETNSNAHIKPNQIERTRAVSSAPPTHVLPAPVEKVESGAVIEAADEQVIAQVEEEMQSLMQEYNQHLSDRQKRQQLEQEANLMVTDYKNEVLLKVKQLQYESN